MLHAICTGTCHSFLCLLIGAAANIACMSTRLIAIIPWNCIIFVLLGGHRWCWSYAATNARERGCVWHPGVVCTTKHCNRTDLHGTKPEGSGALRSEEQGRRGHQLYIYGHITTSATSPSSY